MDWSELLSRAMTFCRAKLSYHREQVLITCSEDCWCWELEELIVDYEAWLSE